MLRSGLAEEVRVELTLRDGVATLYRFATVEGTAQTPAPNGAKELNPAL